MTVLDANGVVTALGSLFAERTTVVLVFVRHFGCIHCREHVEHLQRRIDELHATGAELYVIGNGSPSFIEGFRDQTKWSGPVYTDPSLAVYKAAGMKRGMISTFNPRSALRSFGAIARGYLPQKMQGDNWQQGGVLVIRDGDVVWTHESAGPGDNASVDQLVAALRRAA
jgi:hypothetical protein